MSAAFNKMAGRHNIVEKDESRHVERAVVLAMPQADIDHAKVQIDRLNLMPASLELPVPDGGRSDVSGFLLEEVEKVLLAGNPDMVLVYGASEAAVAGALAAAKLPVPVAHVEAGARTGERGLAEDTNRIAVDRVATLLFCPTRRCLANLEEEGTTAAKGVTAMHTGDFLLDAAMVYAPEAGFQSHILRKLGISPKPRRIGVEVDEPVVLCTLGRETLEDEKRLAQTMRGLALVADSARVIVIPAPAVQGRISGDGLPENVTILDPVSYWDMLELLKRCQVVCSDSHALTREGYFFHKPSILLREDTEWPELVEQGCCRVLGKDSGAEAIPDAFNGLSGVQVRFDQGLFGTGKAAATAVEAMVEFMAGKG